MSPRPACGAFARRCRFYVRAGRGDRRHVTECTGVAVCYCINGDFKDAIAEKVDYYRKAIAAERAKGKAIGYMSVPLSSTGEWLGAR